MTLVPILISSTCGKVGKTDDFLSLEWEGTERSYLLYEPGNLAGKKAPLVIALHNEHLDAAGFRSYFQMDPIAEREGFRVIYPQGMGNNWNVENSPYYGEPLRFDDEGFLSALIDKAIAVHKADPARVYITGYSAGGGMAYTMAWKFPEKLAAIAPLHSAIHVVLRGDFIYDGAVPTLAVHGDSDPYIPMDGGAGGALGKVDRSIGRGFMGVKELVDRVADENGCHMQTEAVDFDDLDPEDGCTAKRFKYTTCEAETDLIMVKGGGHNLPGKKGNLPASVAGNTCRDFDVTEQVWAFFKNERNR